MMENTMKNDLFGKREALVALGSGIALSFSFPGWHPLLSFLAWIALVPYFMMLMKPRRLRDNFLLSLSMGAGLYAGLMYWLLFMHPLTWLGMDFLTSLALVTLAWVLVSVIMALAVAIMGTFLGYAMNRLACPWLLTLTPMLFWVALEYLQGLGILGFTWATLSTSQYRWLPIIQIVSVTGPFFLSGLIVAFNAALAVLFKQRKPLPLALVSVVILSVFCFGQWRLHQPLQGRAFRYALVQGNIKQEEKWQRDTLPKIANTYMRLSDTATADLVVWPETAIPQFLRNDPLLYSRLANYSQKSGKYLLTGTLDWDASNPKYLKLFNAVTVFDPKGNNLGFDYKTHLVALGEYLPFRQWMPPFIANVLAKFNIVAQDYAPAEKPMAFQLPFAYVGTGICFDSIFPWVLYGKVRAGAEALVVVTNDGWYKRTTATSQHLAQAVLRAVETDRYVLRAANTGISCAIDPRGRIRHATRIYEPAVVKGTAVAQTGWTPYVRYRDWAGVLCTLLAGGMLFFAWRRGKAEG